MARTPLLRRLARVAGIADYCDRKGISSQEGVEMANAEARRRVSRREFLKETAKGLAIGGLAAQPLARAFAAPPGTDARIAVVGAGLAGLACAFELAAKNISATVYEASGRVGGRCYSIGGGFPGPDLFPGQVAERGGEFIDTLHTTLRGYANAFGLDLEDVTKEPGEVFYYLDGQLVPESVVVDEYRDLVPALRADLRTLSNQPTADNHTEADRVLDFTNLDEYLISRGAGNVIYQALRAAYLNEYGLEIDQQSALNLLFFIHADRRSKFRPFGVFSDERFHVVSGNQGIPEGLAAGIPGQIELGHTLVRAAKNGMNEVLLTFDTGGQTVTGTFDVVVFALPFSTLRQVDLDATLGLPPEKRFAIDNLVYGTNAKLIVGFDGRPWIEQGNLGLAYANLPNLITAWETNPANATGARAVLTDYTGGLLGERIGQGNVQTQAGRFLGDLDLIFPGAASRASRDARGKLVVDLFHWPSNPLVQGSYTCNQPGYFTTIAGNEGKTVDNLYFIGEHANSFYEWQGFMEGAAVSGVAAAAAIRQAV